MPFEAPIHGISPFSHNSIKITHFGDFSWNWGKFHGNRWFRDLSGDLLGTLHNTCKFYWLFRAPREVKSQSAWKFHHFGDFHEKYPKLVIFRGKSTFWLPGEPKWLKKRQVFCVFRDRCPQGWKKLIFHETFDMSNLDFCNTLQCFWRFFKI